jgi:hypothetical protein
MTRYTRTTINTLIVVCSCIFSLMACDSIGSRSALPSTAPHPSVPSPIASMQGNFVGKVISTDDTQKPEIRYDTNLFIGFVTDGKKILGCLTDGSPQNATLFFWFIGEIHNGEADLQSTPTSPDLNVSPEEMHVTLASDAIIGTMLLSRAAVTVFPTQYQLSFHASLVPSTGNTGIYRAKTTFDNDPYVAGWIVLPDNQQRGAAISLNTSGPSGYGQIIRVLSIIPGTTKTLVVHQQGQKVALEHLQPTSIFQPA